jgi:hypothetical protein
MKDILLNIFRNVLEVQESKNIQQIRKPQRRNVFYFFYFFPNYL